MTTKNIILKSVLFAIFAIIIGISLQIARASMLKASPALNQATNLLLGGLPVLDPLDTRTLLGKGLNGEVALNGGLLNSEPNGLLVDSRNLLDG